MSDYDQARPFPHAVIPDFIDPETVSMIRAEFPNPKDRRWRRYDNALEGKLEGQAPMWGPATRALAERLISPEHLAMLSELTGIADLIPQFTGGGYHMIPRDGRLALHVDFNEHEGLYRRLNFLVFCNPVWSEEWKGDLILTTPDCTEQKRISPLGGKAVVFNTSEVSYHGHPEPLETPHGVCRCSFAAYYFTKEPPPEQADPHSTVFLR